MTKEGDLDKPVLFCCTKRLSLRLQLTQQKQAPEINARWYVIEESLDEACKWYNGKRFGHCTMMYHELASILNRCEAYAGTFQAPVPFPIPQDVKEAAARLEKRYRLKLPHKTFRSYIQFVLLLAEVMLHRKRMKTELEKGLKANGFTTGRRCDPFFIFCNRPPRAVVFVFNLRVRRVVEESLRLCV